MQNGKGLLLASGLGFLSSAVFTVISGCSHNPTLPDSRVTESRNPSNIELDENFAKDPIGDDEDFADLTLPETTVSSIQEQDAKAKVISFDWPVNSARLTRGFIPKPTGKRKRPHLGLDLAALKGTPIFASHEGTVIYVGREFKGYGRMIMVEGKKGLASLYAHLSKSTIKTGQTVHQGDKIGEMGRTGRASGVHLHFEIRTENGPVDPLQYLPTSKIAKN
jgi:murein DD-endopeptidase MepM/ murein hydrolase activator NlpD